MLIAFNEYLPDLEPFGNPGLITAQNCLPYADSFRPLPSLNVLSDALTSPAKGFISVRDIEGTSYSFAGDTSNLYRLVDSSFVNSNRTTSGNYQTTITDAWEFTKWNNIVVATNFTNDVQSITMGQSNFATLAGSPPKARHLAVVRDFLVLGNVSATAATPNRVHWSGFDNIETWTPAASTQADFQDLQGDGGWVQRVVGGEYGTIFQERSIWRMTYIGSPIIFQFDELEPGKGTPCPNSVVKKGSNIFYLGQDDFYVLQGTQSVPIGNSKVYKTFIEDYDSSYYYNVWAEADPLNPFIIWAYPGAGNINGRCNKLLIYNWSINRWSHGDLETEILCNYQAQSLTLDGLDSINSSVDALVYSLDSRVWMGTALNMAAFDSSNQLSTFDGSDRTATFETGEKQLFKKRRGMITNIRPLVDSASGVTVQSGVKNLRHETPTYTTAISLNTDGECPLISEGRYHSFRVSISNGFRQAYGLEIDTTIGGRY